MLFLSGLASILLLGSAVSAEVAHVLFLDHKRSQSEPLTVSPSDARLVFARRLGLSEFHSLQGATDATVEALNVLGGKPQRLFGGANDAETKPQAIIMVEGAEDIFDLRVNPEIASFIIDSAPSPDTNDKLLNTFARQRRYLTQTAKNPSYVHYLENMIQGFGFDKEHLKTTAEGQDVFVQYNGLETTSKRHGKTSSAYRNAVLSARKALSATLSAASTTQDFDIVIALMPSHKAGSSMFKRSEPSYGAHDTLPLKRQISVDSEAIPPASHAAPSTDSKTGFLSELINEAIEEITEMEEALEGAIYSSSNSTSPSGNKTVAPPRGILPACYSSQSACDSRTHGCSGHGSCKLAYSYGSGEKVNCYACACTPSVRTNQDGSKKTTVWAGPACQKKDVSMPFWLLGGFSIALVSMVAFGINLLYSMGQEELPSVIGAGVAGPRAKQ